MAGLLGALRLGLSLTPALATLALTLSLARRLMARVAPDAEAQPWAQGTRYILAGLVVVWGGVTVALGALGFLIFR